MANNLRPTYPSPPCYPQILQTAPSSSFLSSFSVTSDDLKLFHSIDRDVFGRLVVNLSREVEETMRIIGLWLWIESMGFPNIVVKLLPLPDLVLTLVANEAVSCLNVLERGSTASINQLMFTSRILDSTSISLSYFIENRLVAIESILKFVTDVATRAFDDIILRAMNQRAQLLNSIFVGGGGVHIRSAAPAPPTGIIYFAPPPPPPPPRRAVIEADVRGKQVFRGCPSSSTNPPVVSADTTEGSPDDRTLFITFSRGYPITERELRAFFAMTYGDCVQSIQMQDVQNSYLQPLFAKVVLDSMVILDLILLESDEEGKSKFVINGKHAWARKYFSKGSNNN